MLSSHALLSVISALQNVPIFVDRIWLLLVPVVKAEVGVHTTNKVFNDPTCNEEVRS